MIYEPREDSFLLQKYVRKYAKGKILDIGTGLGIQALTALEKAKEVTATDINNEAINFVKKKGINAIKSDLFSNVKGKFDLIIFNPPYLPLDKREDEESALTTTGGKKGYEIISKFLSQLKNYLNKNGKSLIVFSSLTNKNKIDNLINENNLNYKCLENKKLDFEEIYVYLIW